MESSIQFSMVFNPSGTKEMKPINNEVFNSVHHSLLNSVYDLVQNSVHKELTK